MIDLFDENSLLRLYKEEEIKKNFINRSQRLKITSMSDLNTSLEYLLEIKELFQKMLPKMPRNYIMRQVFDYKHCNLVLHDENGKIVGAVCYRPAFDYELVEIVFFAIYFEYHTNGYGTFLFNCFKEVCKRQYMLYKELGDDYIMKNIEISDLSVLGFYEKKMEEDKDYRSNKKIMEEDKDYRSNSSNKIMEEDKDYRSNKKIMEEDKDYRLNSSNKIMEEDKDYRSNSNKKIMEEELREKLINDFNFIGEGERKDYTSNGKYRNVKTDILKNYDEMTNIYLLTYADNSAIGFFKKQGFVTQPVSSKWIGVIKDYDGGTLMECKLHKELNYLRKKELVVKIRNKIFEEMKKVNQFHIIRTWDEREEIASICNASAADVKTENKEIIETKNRTSQDFLNNFLYFAISTLRSDSNAWPFLEPVNVKDVPDYLDVIKEPIDLSLIAQKHKNREYKNIREFVNDVKLMVNNCLTYNNVETQYYNCGEKIQEALDVLLEKYKYIIRYWGFSD